MDHFDAFWFVIHSIYGPVGVTEMTLAHLKVTGEINFKILVTREKKKKTLWILRVKKCLNFPPKPFNLPAIMQPQKTVQRLSL